MGEEQLKILQLIADGAITAGEGEQLLSVLERTNHIEGEPEPEVPSSVALPTDHGSAPQQVFSPPKPNWRRFWLYPILLGGILVLSGFGYTILAATGTIGWGWLFLTLPGLVLGVMMLLLGGLMRSSYWFHIRVKDQDTNIALSFPLPLSWIAWGIRIARPFVPKLADLETDNLLETLAETSIDDAFSLEVHETDGEHVQIYYG